ncbi:MAG: hypothetical protein H6712_13940 [Myxococcales bacterium]|nr:hypothetical protein [Myxococcales bacterium]MCB9714963.1 hypothetical protein [Myxococcales bacterium]
MLSLAASDSSAGAPRIHDGFTPEAQLERHLQRARHDDRYSHWLFGALLVSKVYVTDYEILLGHYGPFIELTPRETADGPTLTIFTSRMRIPAEASDDAEVMPFSELLRSLPASAALELNPGGPCSARVSADEVDMLRRIVAA